MAKNSLNIPFAFLISLLVIASVIIIRGELKKNRFQIETVKIDINMFVDGLFLPFEISNAHSLNARREITIKQDINSFSSNVQNEVCIIAWGSPLARYLSSPISEGRIIKAGMPIAISLLYGELDILLPADYELMVTLGEFCVAGKTLLAK